MKINTVKKFFKIIFENKTVLFKRFGLIFNYLFPLTLLVLFIIFANSVLNNFSVALKVNFNGKDIGYVTSNEVFSEAFKMLEQRLMGVEDMYSTVEAPVYTMSITGKSSLSTPDELCEQMLKATCDNLSEAVGIYYGSELIGVSTNENDLKKSLNYFLEKRKNDADNQYSIEFCDSITYLYGLYPTESLITVEQFNSKINTPYFVTTKYTTQRNDTFLSIAETFNMDYNELISLNTEVFKASNNLKIGTELSVKIPKYHLETQFYNYDKYTDRLEHGVIQRADSSHYIGYSSIASEGVDGLEEISVKNIIKNGEIVDVIVLSRSTVLSPVDEVVTIGTKRTGNVSYLTKYLWPTKTKGFFISAYYGDDRNHKGLDIAIPVNTDIYAADDGIVTTSSFDEGGYGYYVIVTHSDGYKTVYGHCETLLVQVGDTVSRGDLIAYSGNTGYSTGPHLHFEIRYNGDRIDPAPFLGISIEDGSIGAIPKEE